MLLHSTPNIFSLTLGIFFLWNATFHRQDSESGSEGSGSSQSDSESDGNEQPQLQQKQPPPLSHYYPAMQMSSPPGHLQHTFNNNPTTPTQKKKFEERVCVVYIVREIIFIQG